MVTDDECEEPLEGGNASGGVVRRGTTVRKPWLPTTERTIIFMAALEARGVDLPGTHGQDAEGRLVLDFIPGTIALGIVPLGLDLIRHVGALIRSIHQASLGFPVPEDWDVLIPARKSDLLCHNDLAPWNLILDGDRLVFIDWDGAGPSTRLWDLAYAALAFGHLFPDADVSDAAARLAAFADGYAADEILRAALPAAMTERAHAMHELLHRSHETGRQPWATMFVEGHGQHWANTARFIHDHHTQWESALKTSR